MKRSLFFTALLGLALTASFAQTKLYDWKTASSGGYTYKYVTNDATGARFYQLKNGLTVILSTNKREPRIYAMMTTRAGAVNDPRTNTGLAHYLEHLMFKGTTNFGTTDYAKEKQLLTQIEDLYDQYGQTADTAARAAIYRKIDKMSNDAAKIAIANEYDKLMGAMGSQGTNAFTNYEYTSYIENIPTNALDRYLKVQSDRFQNPVFRIFHTELETVYEEKNISVDNDPRKANEALMGALFQKYHLNKSVLGDQEHLKNPNLRTIRKFYDTYYVSNNMALILVGDLNPDELMPKIEKSFAWMKPAPVAEYQPEAEPAITAPVVREVFGPTPDNVLMGFRMPGLRNSKAVLVSTIADEILSNSAAGLLDLNLNKQQKVQNSFSTITRSRDYSVWQMGGTPKAGQSLDEVRDLILGEIEKLKKGDFDDKIIKAIVNNFKLNQIRQYENNQGRVFGYMQAFSLNKGDSWKDNASNLDNLAKITKQDVMAFANQWLGQNYGIVYKRKGVDNNVLKMAKPPITPVSLNRDAQSDFLKTVNSSPMADIKPVFLDFKKDIKIDNIDKLEALYVKNTENALYNLSYRFEMGTWHNKLLPIAFQYLQFLGTDKYTAEQLSKEFYGLASTYNAFAANETTTVNVSGLQENFGKAIALLEHVMRNCKPDEKALEMLKARLTKQRNDAKLNKQAIMSGLRSYATYGSQNPFNNVLSNDEIKAITAQQLVDLLRGLFNYPHKIIYYGPAEMAAFKADMRQLHPQSNNGLNGLPGSKLFSKRATEKNEVLFAHYEMVQADISWIRNTESYNPALTPTISMFNEYFGGNMSSVVFQSLREAKALAYSTGALYMTPQKRGDKYTLMGFIGTQSDKVHDAMVGMNELLTELPQAQNMFELAQKSIKKSIETQRVQGADVIFSYLSAQDKGLDTDERKATYEATDRFTFEDVKKFHAQNLSAKPYTYCVVASDKKVKTEELQKYGELKTLTLEDIFGY
ncbi:MAG: insulinase family protein [Runella slithyformis]|nr:MAG: insulinase family protein [Runella slithyformis]TAF00251.1 MAG: insulinase family protein [Runella slithyformis]TAF81436.1 MAG: insulinase family protein [Runella slithyformis]TAH11193.1 MAG: insulinase family protein [Runella slithyformis]